jgi:hypothetical protein
LFRDAFSKKTPLHKSNVGSNQFNEMTVSTIKAKCRLWGHEFETPFLSDFLYGQFIYSSQDGKNYRYLEVVNNKTWDFVRKVIAANKGLNDGGEIIQSILGHIADKDGTVDFYQNKKIICPTCGRKVWRVYPDTIVGQVEINEMTFERFERLTIEEKEKKIRLFME